MDVTQWVGTVSKLSSNGDGKGVMSIKVGKDIYVETWNNEVSDIGDQTLIEPGSALYRKAITLSVGQRVAFSGTFMSSDVDCVREKSLTLDGSMTEPAYTFRFYDLVPF